MLRLCALAAIALFTGTSPSAREVPAPRSESFALWQPSAESGVETLAGYAQWRRRDQPDGSAQLELELLFERGPGGGERRRVVHVEHLGPDGPRLVWREIAAEGGRTLSLAPEREGSGWTCEVWERAGSRSIRLDPSAGAALPLYLLELVRSGQLASGACTRFDPLTLALEHLNLTTEHGLDEERADLHPALRTAEFLRADGTLAGRYAFRGRSLETFQWQEGGALARRIRAEDWERAA